MADNMMRIAGRDPNGVAKPIPLDKKGELLVALPEVERAVSLNSLLRSEIYNEGIEEKSIIAGYSSGNGSVVKNADHISVKVEGNPTNLAVKSVTTGIKFDLTNANWLMLDFEMTGTTGYDSRAIFAISNNSMSIETDTVAKNDILLSGGNPIKRKVIKLNVAQYTGEYFVRVHLRDSSIYADIHSEMKIYGIYAANKSVNGLDARDKNNKLVKLTAELDYEGFAVLRVVDAAPFAYDEPTDTKKIQITKNATKSLKYVETNTVLTTVNGGNQSISITPPVGEIWKIKSFFAYLPNPSGSTSGTHELSLHSGNALASALIQGTTAHAKILSFGRGLAWADSVDTKYPALQADQQRIILSAVASSDAPLILKYVNSTDVATSRTLTIRYTVEVEKV